MGISSPFSVRVAFAVPALVVPAGDLVGGLQQRLVCKAFSLLQHLCAQHTVGLDHRKFFCGQLAGLIQDASSMPILPISCSADASGMLSCCSGSGRSGWSALSAVQQRLGDDADVPHMRAGLAVTELHDLAQHTHQHIGVLFPRAIWSDTICTSRRCLAYSLMVLDTRR